MTRYAHLYVFDSMADWEPGYAIAELNSGRFLKDPGARIPVRTVGLTAEPIRTMGGMTILPEVLLPEVSPANTALLLLPGGTTWFEAAHAPVVQKARALLAAGVVVAAICGATLRLAQDEVLDSVAHTSDNLDALKALCPGYHGEAHFQHQPAVTAGNLITASGLAPLDFAHHILAKLEVMTPPALEAWFRLNQTREPRHYFALMQALPQQAG